VNVPLAFFAPLGDGPLFEMAAPTAMMVGPVAVNEHSDNTQREYENNFFTHNYLRN
jgi:hypothetical protein